MSTEIELQLDKLLDSSCSVKAPVLTLNGLSGMGKTPIIKEWLEKKGIEYFYIDAPTYKVSTFTCKNCLDTSNLKNDIGMITTDNFITKEYENIFTGEEIDIIDKDNITLFIDNYDWAKLDVRNHLCKLITKMMAYDPRAEYVYFQNIRMIIVTVHPGTSEFSEPLTDYEKKMLGKS